MAWPPAGRWRDGEDNERRPDRQRMPRGHLPRQRALLSGGGLMRPHDAANLAGVPIDEVEQATPQQIRVALVGTINTRLLEVAWQARAHYWRVGDRYFLDDPEFG